MHANSMVFQWFFARDGRFILWRMKVGCVYKRLLCSTGTLLGKTALFLVKKFYETHMFQMRPCYIRKNSLHFVVMEKSNYGVLHGSTMYQLDVNLARGISVFSEPFNWWLTREITAGLRKKI